MSIFHYIFIGLEVVLLFNLLIAVHELGHFLAAKWRGLKIERFAIWFGKPIWKKKVNGIEYALGWIPAGGYVALPQMAAMDMIEGKSQPVEHVPNVLRRGDVTALDTAANVSPLDKIIVAFAGPLFSFLLAIVFAFIVWGVGKPSSAADNSTRVGWVDRSGPAWKAGLRPGDAILEVNSNAVRHFSPISSDSVQWQIITSTGTNVAIKYVRGETETNTVYAVPIHRETKWYERKALRQIMIASASKSMIFNIASNSPADLAGLKPGDEIIKMNGEPVYSPNTVIDAEDAMSNGLVKPIIFTIRRQDHDFDATLTAVKPMIQTNPPTPFQKLCYGLHIAKPPEPPQPRPLLGIMSLGDTNVSLIRQNPIDQIHSSVSQIANTLSALFAKKGEIGVQQLGGAVMILRVYSNLFEDKDGWRRVLWFSVILNVNLALLNLLPLPVLDGGHIVLSLIEAARRRPLSAKLLGQIQSGFAILLITFMVYIMFFDTGDWIRSAWSDREMHVIFTPPAK